MAQDVGCPRFQSGKLLLSDEVKQIYALTQPIFDAEVESFNVTLIDVRTGCTGRAQAHLNFSKFGISCMIY
jgi:hypothetical protein